MEHEQLYDIKQNDLTYLI